MLSHLNPTQLITKNIYQNMKDQGIAIFIMQLLIKNLKLSMNHPKLQKFAVAAKLAESKNENSLPLIFNTLAEMGIPITNSAVQFIKDYYGSLSRSLQSYQMLIVQKQKFTNSTGLKKIKNFPFQAYVDLLARNYEEHVLFETAMKLCHAIPHVPSSLSLATVDDLKKQWLTGKELIKVGKRMEAMHVLNRALMQWIENQPKTLLTKKHIGMDVLAMNDMMIINSIINLCVHSLFKINLDKKDLRLFIQIIATHALNLLELVKSEFQDDATFFHFVYSFCIDWLKISARIIKKFHTDTDEVFLALMYKKQLESQFIYAVMQHDFNEVQNLLLTDPTLAQRIYGYNGQTPVMAAIITGVSINYPMIDLLIDAGADLLAKSKDQSERGFTALHYAVSKGSIKAIEQLVKAKPKILNELSTQGISPLLYAMSLNDKKAIATLINLGANYQVFLTPAYKNNIPHDILEFLKGLSKKSTKITLKKYSDKLLREEKKEKSSTLKAARKSNDAHLPWQTTFDQGELYFENERYQEAANAFSAALEVFEKTLNKNMSEIKIIAEQFQLYRFHGLAALKSADYNNALASFMMAEKLKQQMANSPHASALPAIPSLQGIQFLQAAVMGKLEDAEAILNEDQGTLGKYHIINAEGQNGMTPLMIVAGKTAAHYFIFQRYLVETLAVDINATDEQGRTVLHHAALQNRLDNIVYFTEQHGQIVLNQRDEYGRTALHYAAEAGHASIVTALLMKGTKADILDHDKKYAIDLCKDKKIQQSLSDFKNNALEHKEALDCENIVAEVFELFKNGLVPGTNQYFQHSDSILRAEKILSDNITLNSESIADILRLSEFYRHTKMVLKQRSLLLKALETFPNHIKLLVDTGYLEKFIGNYLTAKVYFKKVHELLSPLEERNKNETNLLIAALMGLVKIYFTEKYYHQIIHYCEQILKIQPNHVNAITHLSSVYRMFNQTELANNLIAKVKYIETPFVLSALMQFHFHNAEYRQAITIGENQLITVAPQKNIRRQVLSLLAQSYEALKDKKYATKYYHLLLSEFPDDFYGKMHFLVFNCKINRKKGEDNLTSIKNMLKQFPCEYTYLNFARELWYNKNYYGALEYYEKTAVLFPESIRVHVELVNSYIAHGLIDRAIFHAEHFLGLFDHSDKIDLILEPAKRMIFSNNPHLQLAYLNALFADNQIEKCIKYTEQCLRFHHRLPWVLEEFENILYQNNLIPPNNEVSENKEEPKALCILPVPDNKPTALKTLLENQPESLITPNGIASFFLNGNAEQTYQELLENKLESVLFPEVLNTQVTDEEKGATHAWLTAQFHNIDLRIMKGRPVSSNEIYFILLTKEVYHWVNQGSARTENIFSMVLQVAERYQFECDELCVLPSDTQSIGLMGYIFSRANFKNVSVAPHPSHQSSLEVTLSKQPTLLWAKPADSLKIDSVSSAASTTDSAYRVARI